MTTIRWGIINEQDFLLVVVVSTPPQYYIVSANNVNTLATQVNALLICGWTCLGGVFHYGLPPDPPHGPNNEWFIQAIEVGY